MLISIDIAWTANFEIYKRRSYHVGFGNCFFFWLVGIYADNAASIVTPQKKKKQRNYFYIKRSVCDKLRLTAPKT